MKLRALVVAVALAVPVLGAAPAQACGGNEVCDRINRICDTVVGPCIP